MLAADPGLVADVLNDPAAVTELLGDLLDQGRSDPGPPARWVIPRFRLGLATVDTTLVPRFERDGDRVRIEAVTTSGSDAGGRLVLDMAATEIDAGRSRLETVWELALKAPVPSAALRLLGPALDRTVASTVQRIMQRTEAAVLAAVAEE